MTAPNGTWTADFKGVQWSDSRPSIGLRREVKLQRAFATTALGRLSTLSVWWIRLGILPELIAPASPQQNGRHERMHRTLKAEATRPPSGNLQAQQVRFNRFRHEYNDDRPHEALDQETPGSAALAGAPTNARAPGIPRTLRSPTRQSQ